MMPILPAICFMAAAVALTTSPPRAASCAAWVAIPSVSLAFSAFWAMEAVICSIEALVSSTPAACSLAACDSDWAVAVTSWAAAPSVPTTPCTSCTMTDRLREIHTASAQPSTAMTTSNDSIHTLAWLATAVMRAEAVRVSAAFSCSSLSAAAEMAASAPLMVLSISAMAMPFSRSASSWVMASP